MKMILPNEGKRWLLDRALTLGANTGDNLNYLVMLFKNDFFPTDASVLADFTEATFTGYASIFLTSGNFAPPVIVANVAEQTGTPAPLYECTSGAEQLCYGWFMADADLNVCLAAQVFNAPHLMRPGAVEVLDPFAFRLKSFT